MFTFREAASGVGDWTRRSSLGQRIARSSPGQHLFYIWRVGRALRPRLLLVRRQLLSKRTAGYLVEGTGQTVVLRHGTKDLRTFDEIFTLQIYELPPPIASALAGGCSEIVDLGGHIGLFTLEMARRFPEARITALEPDPSNADTFRRLIEANGLADRVRLIEACAFNQNTTLRFVAGHSYGSRIARPDEVRVIEIPAVDVLSLARGADFLKIDVEGGEWPILADPRLAELRARAMVVEWHAEGCPGPEPAAMAAKSLKKAGYEVIGDVSRTSAYGVVWCWRNHDFYEGQTARADTTPSAAGPT